MFTIRYINIYKFMTIPFLEVVWKIHVCVCVCLKLVNVHCPK